MYESRNLINYFNFITNEDFISYDFIDYYQKYYKKEQKNFIFLYSESNLKENKKIIIQRSKNFSKFYLLEIQNYKVFNSILNSFDYFYFNDFLNSFVDLNNKYPLFKNFKKSDAKYCLFKFNEDSGTFLFNDRILELNFNFDLFNKNKTFLKSELSFYMYENGEIKPFLKFYFTIDKLYSFIIPLFKGNSSDYFKDLEITFKSILLNKINSTLGNSFQINENTTKGEIIEHLNLCSIIKI